MDLILVDDEGAISVLGILAPVRLIVSTERIIVDLSRSIITVTQNDASCVI